MEWFENAAFWDRMGPFLFDGARWEHAVTDVEEVTGLLGVGPGAHVLDLCCGPGRHALELARRGFRVTGVDLDRAYLARAAAAAPDLEWVHSDMRAFRREGTFDAAINLFTSFGYFRDAADDLRVASNVCASLRPGGAFVIETRGKETVARKFEPRRWFPQPDGAILLVSAVIEPGWGGLNAIWTRIDGAKREDFEVRTRLYSGAELAALLARAGFADVKLCGALDGRPYDDQALALVAVARKA